MRITIDTDEEGAMAATQRGAAHQPSEATAPPDVLAAALAVGARDAGPAPAAPPQLGAPAPPGPAPPEAAMPGTAVQAESAGVAAAVPVDQMAPSVTRHEPEDGAE